MQEFLLHVKIWHENIYEEVPMCLKIIGISISYVCDSGAAWI